MGRTTRSTTKSRLADREERQQCEISCEDFTHCLMCWKLFPLDEDNDETGVALSPATYPVMEGAIDSVLLRKQLCHWFILRNLLDVPRYWCENKLASFSILDDKNIDEKVNIADSTDDLYGGPGMWFQVCAECLNSLVTEAWQIQNQILSLEERMKEIKVEVKRKIRDNYTSRKDLTGSARGKWTNCEKVAMEIRKLVVSEIEELAQTKKITTEQEKAQCSEDDNRDSYPLPLLEINGNEIKIVTEEERELPLLTSCEDEITDDIALGGHDFSSDIDYDDGDDPNDDNWIPPNQSDEDVLLDHTEEISAPTGDSIINTKMRTRGKDKKKRKPKSYSMKMKGIAHGPYKKKIQRAKSQLRQLPPQPKIKVEICIEDPVTNGTPSNDQSQQEGVTTYVKKFGKRGKDRMKRKCKVRIRKDRPKRILYPCSLCACLPFLSSEEFELHTKLHEERKNAQINGANVNPKENLDCDQCSFPARDTVELRHHIRDRHDIPARTLRRQRYPCPLCPRETHEWGDITHHIKRMHASAPPDVVATFMDRFLNCNLCEFRGELPRNLIIHKRRHKVKTSPVQDAVVRRCEECGQMFTDERSYQIHFSNTHRRLERYVCEVCGRGFGYPKELRSHEVTHTKNLKRDWVCHVCGVDFPRKGQLEKHCRMYHPEDIEVDKYEPTDQRDTGATAGKGGSGKIYSCRYCDLTSPYNAVIRKHLQIHKQQGDHKCEKCGKFYMNMQGLKRHLRINHNESGEQIPCPHCLKPFASKEYMMIHIKRFCKMKQLTDP